MPRRKKEEMPESTAPQAEEKKPARRTTRKTVKPDAAPEEVAPVQAAEKESLTVPAVAAVPAEPKKRRGRPPKAKPAEAVAIPVEEKEVPAAEEKPETTEKKPARSRRRNRKCLKNRKRLAERLVKRKFRKRR